MNLKLVALIVCAVLATTTSADASWTYRKGSDGSYMALVDGKVLDVDPSMPFGGMIGSIIVAFNPLGSCVPRVHFAVTLDDNGGHLQSTSPGAHPSISIDGAPPWVGTGDRFDYDDGMQSIATADPTLVSQLRTGSLAVVKIDTIEWPWRIVFGGTGAEAIDTASAFCQTRK